MSNPLHILYADDHLADSKLIQARLKRDHGRFLLTTVDTRTAFEVSLTSASYDLILCDRKSFGYQGLHVLDIIQQIAPHVPVIIITAPGSEELAIEAMKRGVSDYVVKTPQHIHHLPHTLLVAVEKRLLQEERQRTRIALLESEERFRYLFDLSPDGIMIVDTERTIRMVNSTLLQMLGATTDQVLGRNMFEFIVPGDFLSTSQIVTTFVRNDGVRFPTEVSAGRFVLGGKEVTQLIVRDITERMRAGEALRESEERYRQIVETAMEGIWKIDAEGRTIFVNRPMSDMLGYTESEMIHVPIRTFVDREEQVHMQRRLERQRQGIREHFDFKFCRKDGASLWTQVSVNPLFDVAGRYVGTLAMIIDISERKQATEQLLRARLSAEERAVRFRLLVEMGRDLVSAQGLDPLLTLALERATAFSGYDGGSIILMAGPESTLEVRASVGADAVMIGTRVDDFPRSVSGQVLQSKRPLVLEGHGESIGVAWRTYTKSIPSTITLPLIGSNDNPIGVLTLKSTSRRIPLNNDDLDALELLASQLAVTIERSRLHEEKMHLLDELAEREHRLQDLVEKLLVSQEEERRRVAYELHDGLAQVASSAHQHLQTFASLYHPRAVRNRQELNRALNLAQRVVQEARQVIAGLRPTILDDFGLVSALRQEVKVLQADGWEITFDELQEFQRLPSTHETAFFRIAQEALTNVRKHAHTTRVRMALRCQNQVIRLEVQDQGCGFDPATLKEGAGPGENIGLLGMQERVTLLGGKLLIQSKPGAGTLIVAEVPMPMARECQEHGNKEYPDLRSSP